MNPRRMIMCKRRTGIVSLAIYMPSCDDFALTSRQLVLMKWTSCTHIQTLQPVQRILLVECCCLIGLIC